MQKTLPFLSTDLQYHANSDLPFDSFPFAMKHRLAAPFFSSSLSFKSYLLDRYHKLFGGTQCSLVG